MVIARILRNIGPAINTVLPGRCAVLNDRTLANAASTCMAEQHAARRKFGAYWGSIIDYQYYLHATGWSAFVPSKASFFNALRGGGIELKHVKNADELYSKLGVSTDTPPFISVQWDTAHALELAVNDTLQDKKGTISLNDVKWATPTLRSSSARR